MRVQIKFCLLCEDFHDKNQPSRPFHLYTMPVLSTLGPWDIFVSNDDVCARACSLFIVFSAHRTVSGTWQMLSKRFLTLNSRSLQMICGYLLHTYILKEKGFLRVIKNEAKTKVSVVVL